MKRFAAAALSSLIMLSVVTVLLATGSGVQAMSPPTPLAFENLATEWTDAGEPLVIECNGEVYTAVDGYFKGRGVLWEDGSFSIASRTDPTRNVLLEDTGGGRFIMKGTAVAKGVATPAGDIVNSGHIAFRLFDADDLGKPVEVVSASFVGPLSGTCETFDMN